MVIVNTGSADHGAMTVRPYDGTTINDLALIAIYSRFNQS